MRLRAIACDTGATVLDGMAVWSVPCTRSHAPSEPRRFIHAHRQALVAVAVLGLGVVLFFVLDLGLYLRLSNIKSSQAQLEAWRAAQPLQPR